MIGKPPKQTPSTEALSTENSIRQEFTEKAEYLHQEFALGLRRIDFKSVRVKIGMSLEDFAVRFGFEEKDLRAWESRIRQPSTAASLMLYIIEKHPDIAEEVIGGLRADGRYPAKWYSETGKNI